MSDKLLLRLILCAVGLVVALIGLKICADIVNVEGYEVGVVHKWRTGVQDEPLRDGLHIVWFGNVHKINIGTQKISFAKQLPQDQQGVDTADNEFPEIEVACGKDGGQKARIILTAVYHLDPIKAVKLYKDNLHKTYRYTIMKRTIIDVVNRLARPKEALEIYSGEGFNTLRDEIDDGVKTHPVMIERGINIENATLYDVELDPDYEMQIELKQLAKQEKLRAQEQALAAMEEAKKEKAQQQIMVEQRRAEADAKKIEVVLNAEAEKAQVVLNAEAEKAQVTLAAEAEKERARLSGEGEKLRMVAQAEGERALGLAQAEVEDAKKKAMYDGEAGLRRAQVTVATALAEKLKGLLSGVKVIPKDAFVALMQEGGNIPLALTDQGVMQRQSAQQTAAQ